jgi:hypothetical protein
VLSPPPEPAATTAEEIKEAEVELFAALAVTPAGTTTV